MAHAKLSPSSAVRWLTCPGSVVLSAGLPERRSMAAARGTVQHQLAALALEEGTTPLLQTIGEVRDCDGIAVTIDESMVEAVEQYVAEIREAAQGGELMVEQQVPIGRFTGEEGATGTADAIIIKGRRLEVRDAKFGHHEIDPVENWQAMLYALGALDMLSDVQDFDEVLIVIHQPEHGAPKEWLTTPDHLKRFGVRTLSGALRVKLAEDGDPTDSEWQVSNLSPSNDACRHCPARATCPSLKREIDAAVTQEFDDLTEDKLGESMSMVERVEAWCKAVRAEVERRLLSRTPVPGYKLVIGRRGARKFSDVVSAESLLKAALGEDAYTKELITPTTAEKLLKKAKPETWAAVAAVITQSEGKPSVAPESDKREAYSPGAGVDEFEVITEE